MTVAWLSLSSRDVPAGDGWLGPRERAAQARLRFAPRRADWRLGRRAAKQAVAAWLGIAVEEVEVLAAADGAPEAWRGTARLPVALSLSHRAGRALAVVGDGPGAVGCDLELVEPRSAAFVAEWLTPAEQRAVASASSARDAAVEANLAWAAKEAGSKALREGLRLDVRHAESSAAAAPDAATGWRPLLVRWAPGAVTRGWWRSEPRWVMTVCGPGPMPAPPVELLPPGLARSPVRGFCPAGRRGGTDSARHEHAYRRGMRSGRTLASADGNSVVVADDHPAIRQALRALVERPGGLVVVAEADDTDDALELVARLHPAVLLLDLGLRGAISSLETITRVLSLSPRTRVVVVTMQSEPVFARAAMRAGAAGYVLKDRADDVLARAIHVVADGGQYLDSEVGAALAAEPEDVRSDLGTLTMREEEVVGLVARGHENAAIAVELGISVRTVETHRARIHRKLRHPSRDDLFAYAADHGLLAD